MELTKSQERRLAFVASLLSLNPNDPNDRIKPQKERHTPIAQNVRMSPCVNKPVIRTGGLFL